MAASGAKDAEMLTDALTTLREAFIKRNGCFPLPHTQGYEAMEFASAALAATKRGEA